MKEIFGAKNYISHSLEDGEWPKAVDVVESWKKEAFNWSQSDSKEKGGFRIAQLGALHAIKAHWTVSSKAATVVMPTGTGKTEVMIATVVSECCRKACVLVPSNLLRQQTVDKFMTLGVLRQIGAISNLCANPVVGCLGSTPKNIEELQTILNRSNVIITTVQLLSSKNFCDDYRQLLSKQCDLVIIDEAHHIPSKSWGEIKDVFTSVKCLQFTATPFRNDGKKIDGDIIYNYPLAFAQQEGYFKPINYYRIREFDVNESDRSIARKAVELLKEDIAKGYPHLLLVRSSTKDRARDLYNNIYQKYYSEYEPVLIVSGNGASANRKALEKVKHGNSKIIVCVDMFSEGIDVPELKICAIHDKYKSLPITLQFIGRFARAKPNLGPASVVANVVDEDVAESLDVLYSQDSDWNVLLSKVSEDQIGKEITFQKLSSGFKGTEEIPLSLIRPKISMFMYKRTEKTWHWWNWEKVFDSEHCRHYVNEDEKILIVTELCTSAVDWTTSRDVADNNWNLHILYWNESKGVFFINSTNKGIADKFAKAIFDNNNRIDGEDIFRCLHGIKRLMLSAVGLKNQVSQHRIRYKMFAGVDVGEGIRAATVGFTTKSNLFGVGYEEGESVSIGCSYKGIVWAKLVETIDFWKDWCDRQADKILNSKISTKDILSGVLIPELINSRPNKVPYRIDLPDEIEFDFKGIMVFKTVTDSQQFSYIDIGLITQDDTSPLEFYVSHGSLKEQFVFEIKDQTFSVKHKNGDKFVFCEGKLNGQSLEDYFNENPPKFWFVDGSSLEGNFFVELKNATLNTFPKDRTIVWSWSGINIRKESQTERKESDSIQYRLIAALKESKKYSLIFDDDGPGEVADVIAIQEDDTNNELLINLYHCKYSSSETPGTRVTDLYEVCGQAEKSVGWAKDVKFMMDRLLKRAASRESRGGASRYELGDNEKVRMLKRKLKFYKTKFKVYIVQPGVDSRKISKEMHQVLCSADSYLQDTFGIPLVLICS